MNESVLVSVAAGVTTVIGPLVAPVGTAMEILVAVTDFTDAATPLMRTAVAPVSPVP